MDGLPDVPLIPELPVNQEAPDFLLPDLDGKIHRLQSLRGNIVIINFWSSGCPICRKVDEQLNKWIPHWEQPVIHLNIASNANESLELIRETAPCEENQTLLLDPDHQVADLYGVLTTPHLYVIDREGILRYRGAFDDVTFRRRAPTREYLVDAVSELIAGDLPEPAETPSFGCVLVRQTD